jgi:acyl-homoserine lactone acylase PvdQ
VRRSVLTVLAVLVGLLALPLAALARDTARYILPPGNFGGLPTSEDSLDQLPLYDALTPLRDNITKGNINNLFLPENFAPIGKTHAEKTGRPGLRLIYDSYGIPHVYGKTRADVAFGAGWTTARDRRLLVDVGRAPARVAVADVPNIDAFSLVTNLGSQYVPSRQAEALVTKQKRLLVKTYGAKGREILADARAYIAGANAYARANNLDTEPGTVNDVIATTAFIGSIFGAGGGGEADNSELLAKLRQGLGRVRGYKAWDDIMLADDPEAPTTIKRRFDYGPFTGGKVRGSMLIDPGSIESLVPGQPDPGAAPARLRASNFQVVAPQRSATGNSLATMGPQLGYYYPEIVQQIDLHGPGINAQGVAVPGLAMYILIGRTKNYAWSLTSAGHDVRDVFAERLCEPNGSAPTRDSRHYLYKGKCRAFREFNAGLLDGKALRYPVSVHGPVIATATVGGRPYALARKRSTFGRDALNLAALHDLTEGDASTPRRFWSTANQFGFTFNWAYVSRKATAYFSSGYLPKRAPGLDRRLPTLGTGGYEWRGFLSRDQHPHAVGGPRGLLLNWNNHSAPGFMHGDDEPYGSVQHVELFDKFPRRPKITDVVGVMNRAATEDDRSLVWPLVSRVLRTGPAQSDLDRRVVALLDRWVAQDAPRLDADNDRLYDSAGPTIMDALWRPIVDAVMRPVLGAQLGAVNEVRGLGSASGESYVDKDLRRLLGQKVRGKFNLRYCGKGSLRACRQALSAAVHSAAESLSGLFGNQDPSTWLKAAGRTTFVPRLIPNDMRATNRPTFQQVLELEGPLLGSR